MNIDLGLSIEVIQKMEHSDKRVIEGRMTHHGSGIKSFLLEKGKNHSIRTNKLAHNPNTLNIKEC